MTTATKKITNTNNNQVPNGAKETILSLSTYYKFKNRWVLGLPTLLWGEPGEGKTSFLYMLGQEQPVETLIGSIHDPTDLSGLPYLSGDSNKTVVFARPHFFDRLANGGILFLDEINTAPPSVQGALLQLVLERRVGTHTLPDNVRVVAAANPPNPNSAIGFGLHHALANRFLHIEWSLTTTTYCKALLEGWEAVYNGLTLQAPPLQTFILTKQKTQSIVSAYLSSHSSSFRGQPSDSKTQAFATPRTWDYVSSVLATGQILNFDAEIISNCVRGCIGNEEGIKFWKFYSSLKLIGGGDILKGNYTPQDLKNMSDNERQVVAIDATNIWIENKTPEGLSNLLHFYIRVCELGTYDIVYPSVRKLIKHGIPQNVVSTQIQTLFQKLGEHLRDIVEVIK